MATIENEYYLRSVLLLLDGGSYIANVIISRELPKKGGSLDALLQQERLKKKIKKEFQNKGQLEKLYPSSGDTDLDTWDIQMLTNTILILFPSDLKTKEKSSLRNIRRLRHGLAHSPKATLKREKYEEFVDDLYVAIMSLASECEENVQKKCADIFEKYKSCALDIKSSIEQIKEMKDNDDKFVKIFEEIEKNTTKLSDEISNATSQIRQTVYDRSQETDNKIADVKQTMCSEMQKVQADLEDLKRILRKEPFKRIRSIVNSRLKFSGDEGIVDLADKIVLRVINAAIKKAKDATDMEEVRKAVDDILEELDKIEGVTVLAAEPECIIVRIQCDTYKSLYDVLEYITSPIYHQRLNAIAGACCPYLKTSKPLMLHSDISEECLQNITDEIGRSENIKQSSFVLPVQCETIEGAENVVKLFESDILSDKFQTLSEALSKQLKGGVSVEAAVNKIYLKEEEELEETDSSEEKDHQYIKDLLLLEGNRASSDDEKDQLLLGSGKISSSDQKDQFSLEYTETLSKDEKVNVLLDEKKSSIKDDEIASEEIQTSSKDERDQISLEGNKSSFTYKAKQGQLIHVQPVAQERTSVVAAIDIGITFTAYAYSFRTEYDRDHFKIYTYQDWKNALDIPTSKTPSVVLFDKAGNFHSFGYETEEGSCAEPPTFYKSLECLPTSLAAAEIKYSELMEEEDNAHYGWRYFSDLSLGRQRNRTLVLADVQNQLMPALDVYAAVLKYLKDRLLQNLSYRLPDLNETEIKWIISLPALLSDMERQLIADATEKACFSNDRLTFALNPEVAAIYCKELSASSKAVVSRRNWFRPGERFIVLDVGGKTINVTAHEVLANGTMSEIPKSSELSPIDGSWGGCLVDAKLKTVLDNIFGCDVMRKFRHEYKLDALELLHASEMMKRQCIDPESEKEDFQVWLKLPATLLNLYESMNGHRFSEGVTESNLGIPVLTKRKKMYVSNDFIIELYRESKKSLTSHLRTAFQNYPELNCIKTIILTGGFMDSEIVRHEIRLSFPKKDLVFPDIAGLAIVKGAVMFGCNSKL